MITIRKLIATTPVYLIYILSFLLPLIFTPFTTEFFETAKLIFLAAVVLLMLFFWGLKAFTENKISLIKTPFDLLLLLFLLVAFLATVFSSAPYISLFGILPKVSGSLMTLTAVVLLYFMTVSNIRSLIDVRIISQILIFSGFILSTVSLLSYFKIYLPWEGAQYQNFSLTGNSTSAAAFLVLILPLTLFMTFLDKNLKNLSLSTLLGTISITIFIITIILIGTTGIWIAAIFGLAVTLYFKRPSKEQLGILGIILGIGLLIAILAYTPTLKDKTPLGSFSSTFQKNIELPFIFSWKISAGVFRDSPILGSGPSTHLYDFTKYKPLELNRTDLWDKKISFAHNSYLESLAETGGAGFILLILITISFIFLAYKFKDNIGFGAAGITFFILMALSPNSVLIQAFGFLIIALFMSGLKERSSQVKLIEVRLSTESGVHPLLPALIFIPILSLIFTSGYFVGKLALGEYYHRAALNLAAKGESLSAYNNLVLAEKANPEIDLYRVDLAQTSLALANAIASQKGPTEASPSGSLTDADKRNIQQLLQQSIAEGRNATTISPNSAQNWEALAQIYKQLSGVTENATAFSLDSYGRAIQQNPLNPLLRVGVGGIYYQLKNYDLAVRFFDDAVVLKPDFSNGLYNLAIALRDKGNRSEAIKIAEKLVSTLQDKPESVDYTTASNLLTELKNSESSAAPEDSGESALDKSSVPNLGLPEPEKISTPPAVQR